MDGSEVCSFKTKKSQGLSLSWCSSQLNSTLGHINVTQVLHTYLSLFDHPFRMLPIWRGEGSNFIEICWHSFKKLSTEKGMGQKLHKIYGRPKWIIPKVHQTFSIYGELNQLYLCLKETCEVTDDCSDGLICLNQKCKPCFRGGQCPLGHYCKDGSCKKEKIEDTCDTSLVRFHNNQ